jgi:hypothetical protein
VGWYVRVGEGEEGVADFGWEIDFSGAGLADVGVNQATPEHQHIAALFGQWRDGAPGMAVDHLGVVLAVSGGVHGEFEVLKTVVL